MEFLRLVVFNDALQDLRAMQALSDKTGYEKPKNVHILDKKIHSQSCSLML